jgi:hypothetical protein
LKALIYPLLGNAMVEKVNKAISSEGMVNLGGDGLLIRVTGLEKRMKVYDRD